MRFTLKFKINAAILATFLIIAFLFIIIELPFEKQRYQSLQNKVILVLKTMVERDRDPLANEIFDDSVRAIRLRLKKMMKVEGMYCVHVFDDNGNMLASEGFRHPVTLPLSDSQTAGRDLVTVREKGIQNTNTFEYIEEIRVIGERIGYVVIHYSLEQIEKEHHKAFLIFLGFLFTVFIVLVILLNFMLSKTIIKPITFLRDAMEQARINGITEKVDIKKNDEIGDLAQTFNHMSKELRSSYDDLETKNRALIHREKEVNDVRRYLKNIIESMPSVLVGIDLNGRITQWNREAENFSGIQAEDSKGKYYKDVLPQLSLLSIETVEKAIKKGIVQKKSKVPSGSGGSVRYLDITLYPLFGSDSEEAVMRIDDITDHVRMEERIQQAQKMEAIGTLAGGIAHDFNNILSGIFGYAQLAEMHLNNPEKTKHHIGNIMKGAQRATELVQQILTFSRKTDYEKSYLHLYIIVKEVLKLLRSTIPATIEIEEKIIARSTMLANPTQMHQVIMNLCTNAYHAMFDKGGVLCVTLDEITVSDMNTIPGLKMAPGRYIELSVSDTGCGMSEKTKEKLFKPYFTTKVREKGTGLGLALVHAIVEEHRGHIKVESIPDKGSTFCVYLPVAEKESDESSIMLKDRHAPVGDEKILFVDDEEDIRYAARELLQGYGYKVDLAANGMEALERFKRDSHGFDVVITDMTMPGMTGDEMAVNILKIRKDIPIILCTGYSEKIDEEQARAVGIRRYALKPLTGEEMAFLVREVLIENKRVERQS